MMKIPEKWRHFEDYQIDILMSLQRDIRIIEKDSRILGFVLVGLLVGLLIILFFPFS